MEILAPVRSARTWSVPDPAAPPAFPTVAELGPAGVCSGGAATSATRGWGIEETAADVVTSPPRSEDADAAALTSGCRVEENGVHEMTSPPRFEGADAATFRTAPAREAKREVAEFAQARRDSKLWPEVYITAVTAKRRAAVSPHSNLPPARGFVRRAMGRLNSVSEKTSGCSG